MLDTDGYRLTVFDKDDTTVLFRRYGYPTVDLDPSDEDEDYYIIDSSDSSELDVVGITLNQYEIDVLEDAEGSDPVNVTTVSSDGSTGLNFNGLGTGGEGPYLADMNFDSDTGVAIITPRSGTPGQYVGTTTFYFRTDFAEAILVVNVLPAA